MLGAILGDIVGSIYESPSRAIKRKDFPLVARGCVPTDDTILTVATAEVLLSNGDLASTYRRYYARYPDAGFGTSFIAWARDRNAKAYGSWGNGSAMRVSPIGFYCRSLEDVLAWAKRSAEVTHNHPDAIKGAQAIAAAVYLAKQRKTKDEIASFIRQHFRYDVDRTIGAIRATYGYDLSCEGSVPEAIVAFLESTSVEDAIRNAVSLGGDSDTLATMAGGIAEAFYGMPRDLERLALSFLDKELRRIVDRFGKYRRR